MIEKISTSQSPAYISLTFPSYEALSEGFKSDKRKPRMSPAGTHGVLSGQINIRLSTCLIPEGAVVLKCEYLKGEHKRKGAFTCYRSGRKRAAISFWELPATAPSHARRQKSGCRFRGVPFGAPRPLGRAARVRTTRSRSLPG